MRGATTSATSPRRAANRGDADTCDSDARRAAGYESVPLPAVARISRAGAGATVPRRSLAPSLASLARAGFMLASLRASRRTIHCAGRLSGTKLLSLSLSPPRGTTARRSCSVRLPRRSRSRGAAALALAQGAGIAARSAGAAAAGARSMLGSSARRGAAASRSSGSRSRSARRARPWHKDARARGRVRVPVRVRLRARGRPVARQGEICRRACAAPRTRPRRRPGSPLRRRRGVPERHQGASARARRSSRSARCARSAGSGCGGAARDRRLLDQWQIEAIFRPSGAARERSRAHAAGARRAVQRDQLSERPTARTATSPRRRRRHPARVGGEHELRGWRPYVRLRVAQEGAERAASRMTRRCRRRRAPPKVMAAPPRGRRRRMRVAAVAVGRRGRPGPSSGRLTISHVSTPSRLPMTSSSAHAFSAMSLSTRRHARWRELRAAAARACRRRARSSRHDARYVPSGMSAAFGCSGARCRRRSACSRFTSNGSPNGSVAEPLREVLARELLLHRAAGCRRARARAAARRRGRTLRALAACRSARAVVCGRHATAARSSRRAAAGAGAGARMSSAPPQSHAAFVEERAAPPGASHLSLASGARVSRELQRVELVQLERRLPERRRCAAFRSARLRPPMRPSTSAIHAPATTHGASACAHARRCAARACATRPRPRPRRRPPRPPRPRGGLTPGAQLVACARTTPASIPPRRARASRSRSPAPPRRAASAATAGRAARGRARGRTGGAQRGARARAPRPARPKRRRHGHRERRLNGARRRPRARRHRTLAPSRARGRVRRAARHGATVERAGERVRARAKRRARARVGVGACAALRATLANTVARAPLALPPRRALLRRARMAGSCPRAFSALRLCERSRA